MRREEKRREEKRREEKRREEKRREEKRREEKRREERRREEKRREEKRRGESNSMLENLPNSLAFKSNKDTSSKLSLIPSSNFAFFISSLSGVLKLSKGVDCKEREVAASKSPLSLALFALREKVSS